MRKLLADILDPETTYELSVTSPVDLVRALHIDARFRLSSSASSMQPFAP